MVAQDIPKGKEIQECATSKIMAAVISDETGIILGNFLAKRATVKPDCYTETLRHSNVHLRPISLTRKLPEMLLLHSKGRLRTSARTTEAIIKFR